MTSLNTPLSNQQALGLRLCVGVLFGLILAWLTDRPHTLEYVPPEIWRPAATTTFALGAFILWAGAGAMRRMSLAAWGTIALAVIAFISWHHTTTDFETRHNPFFNQNIFLIYPLLFITHELVAAGDQSRKWIAPYSVYNDETWHRGVQLVLALLFTGLFWGILLLGALLLGLIGFKWFGELLTKSWVAFPLSGLALGVAVHLGDSQPKLIAGVRALVLGILSWLLPVLAAIGLLFAVSLCFSGLEPLWKTKAATAALLSACVGLVLLINAAYQEGDETRKVHAVLKWSARVACGLLLVFSILAAYSLWLRIDQYGLTPERVLALVGVIIAVLFGLGYAAAAAWPQGWLRDIKGINIGMAVLMALIFLAVLTPIADPNRLSADSQASRLQSGKVAPDKFDWRVLRFNTGTYGQAALKDLIKTGKTDGIRAAALKASRYKDDERYQMEAPQETASKKADPKQFAVVFPQGATIPEDFFTQEFKSDNLPDCATEKTATPACSVAMIDITRDGKPELLILHNQNLVVMVRDETGWRRTSDMYLSEPQVTAFKAGKLSTQLPKFDDVKIGDDDALRVWDTPSVRSERWVAE